MEVPELRRDLLAWGERTRRDLPWRRTRDPWAILVSELMLQQTQVPRVVPKFDAFMAEFPTPGACAAAPRSRVIEAWSGLGYNRRAVNLHRTAQLVVAEHGGTLPSELDALLGLPGIGPYTARAVLVFAHERDLGVVDTNVARLLARWTGSRRSAADAQNLADALVPAGHAWAWNQAMFDLGAAVCRARAAACGECPVRTHCSWQGSGDDPAAPAVRQSTFEGSDRQGRGRLIETLRANPVADHELAAVMGWPDDVERARQVAQTLVADGLVVEVEGGLRLPS